MLLASGVADESLELDTLLPESFPSLTLQPDWRWLKVPASCCHVVQPFRPKQTKVAGLSHLRR